MWVDELPDGFRIRTHPTDTEELREIVNEILPEWLRLFARKNAEYGEAEDNEFELGPRAAFVDMSRKMRKLKRALWDGEEGVLQSEGVEEILFDFIAHCFLIAQSRRKEG